MTREVAAERARDEKSGEGGPIGARATGGANATSGADATGGAYYDERRQFLMVEGVIARDIVHFPLAARQKRSSRAAAFDGLGGNTTLGIHLSEIAPGGDKQGHRHLDEATFYIVAGRGWTELRQADDAPLQRVDWAAGDILVIPSNAWHQHFNASPDEPALQLAFKNTRLLRKLFHSREFVYQNPFRFSDRYGDEPDYWSRREPGNYGKVRANVLSQAASEPLPADPDAGEGVSIGRFSMGGHRMLEQWLVEIERGGAVREHLPLAEEAMLVLAGAGATTLRAADGREVTVEWQTGDLLAPPFGVRRSHAQRGEVRARYLLVRNNFIERALGVKGNVSLDGAFSDRFPSVLEADREALAAAVAAGGRDGSAPDLEG